MEKATAEDDLCVEEGGVAGADLGSVGGVVERVGVCSRGAGWVGTTSGVGSF